jgi:hypothetical protein
VLLRVGLVLALLELAYVVPANLLLMTPLLRRVVNPAEDVELDYDWAYSPWPGRIYVKNLALRVEDYNVQFFVGVERGALDVRIEELLWRRFHAVRVAAEGTSYRMRHKLHAVGLDARRVSAYPPIAGFADPPLYRGPPPPPIPDSEYALWDVQIENVAASIREVWILEYRYQGRGRAWGSFHVRPARYYDVEAAGLELEQGRLTVAGVPAAERAKLSVECRVLGSDPRKGSGLEPLRTIYASVRGALERADLRFLNVYGEPRFGLSTSGSGDLELALKMDAGTLAEGSRMVLSAPDLRLHAPAFGLHGPVSVELAVPSGQKPEGVRIAARSERLTLFRPGEKTSAPYAEDTQAHLAFTRDLSRPLRIAALGARLPRLTVPELGFFAPLFGEKQPKLGGTASASLSVERDERENLYGESSVRLAGTRFELAPVALAGSFGLDARFELTGEKPRALSFGQLDVHAERASLALGEQRSPPWTAKLSSRDATLSSLEPLRAHGSVELRAERAEPLLPLVVESPVLRDLLVASLGLAAIRGRALFELEPTRSRLELREARSGALTVRGFVESRPEQEPNGRFLLATRLANVGLYIRAGELDVKPLVGDDWLSKGAFVLPRAAE